MSCPNERLPRLIGSRAVALAAVFVLLTAIPMAAAPSAGSADALVQKIGMRRGICAVLGLPDAADAGSVTALAGQTELVVYFQSPDAQQVAAVRRAARQAGLLGHRIFADRGDWRRVHLADNLAGAVWVAPAAERAVAEEELLRVLHPGGKALVGGRELVKPFPDGVDAWSHPYHGPDNNPQSRDQLARAPYLTQFVAEPKFCPMPEVSVAAGGRVFRAFGHIAHKANQNPMLNTLIAVNAYNGTILWKRALPEGFMIHRNTIIATADTLYLGDHRSCKLIDAATGKVKDEIVVPGELSDGPVWKWMALVDGVLYALVGGQEFRVPTQRSNTPGLGHWPWGMWPGHDYQDPKTNFGFGRTFLAIDPATKKILWNHRETDYVDARGVCMGAGHIYFYCPGKRLGCLDAADGRVLWKNDDADLLQAIGPEGKAQHYVTGYSTSAYIKCNDSYIFFAGSQRSRLVVARADDGRLLWQREHGNFHLVLRDDGFYAVGPQQRTADLPATGYKLAYATGEVLAQLPMRRACTRATGAVDSVFFRASGGTVRIDTATGSAHHIAPMRPPCQDGVIISDGNLYWGPWMCGCQLSLYGHICLTSAGRFDSHPAPDASRLETHADSAAVKPLEPAAGDWPTYQGDNRRSGKADVTIPRRVRCTWRFQLPGDSFPTAPVTAGGMVFLGDRAGTIWALDAADGSVRWQASTGAAIYQPPTIDGGRLFAGSADGRVYALEAVSGRPLWTFRAAPAERWIPVYGKLISTWPVAGGVVVQDGVVYAAAGIAHYDGTHVYALDAASGRVRWYNGNSGTTSKRADHGVSLQGNLYIRDGELRFVGGGVHEEARYDLASGKCLNQPVDVPRSTFHTAFYAYYPGYGKHMPLDCTLSDGTALCYDCTYEGSWHGPLMRLPALPPGQRRPPKPISRWGIQRRRQGERAIWQKAGQRFNSFVLAGDVLLAAGYTGSEGGDTSFLAAVRTDDGADVWREKLPGPVVKGGAAVNHRGQIFVSLESGQLLALGDRD